MEQAHHPATVVLTGKSLEHILADGGTQSWVLDRNNALRRPYVVCCRSSVAWVEGNEEAGSAFLVGRVSKVVPSSQDPGRWCIQISEFARVNKPNVWKGWRNPVRYLDLSELGIDLNRLTFEPMPAPMERAVATPPVQESRGLSIAEAKRGLAQSFGVSEDAVQITIRG